ncbi:MAG: polyprenyl synthetase family protein [Phototrophicaceae bacterium]
MEALTLPETQVEEITSDNLDSVIEQDTKLIQAIDNIMLESTRSQVTLLQDASWHIIQSGGKRVRPRMLLLSYIALGGTGLKTAMDVAAGIELVHTASVVHDDINDHGIVRRGVPSVNAKWGRTFALLTGDFLFTKVYEITSQYPLVAPVFADATIRLVEGETLQAYAVKNKQFDMKTYYNIIGLKTAVLFSAATKLGAMLAGANDSVVQTLSDFGYKIGMAFQIFDDLLDLTGDTLQLGKTAGLDVEQGKGLSQVLSDSPDPMVAIKSQMMNAETIELGQRMAQQFVDDAVDLLNDLPDSLARTKLIEIAHSVVNRNH